jgi:hypothetical protein
MQRRLDEWQEYIIAGFLAFAIDDLNPSIVLADQPLQGVRCLNDLVALTERLLQNTPEATRRETAIGLVQGAVARALPKISMPRGDIRLRDAFGPHLEDLLAYGR